jgi:hypothetical protein
MAGAEGGDGGGRVLGGEAVAPGVDWAAVRVAYETGGESVAVLLRKYGLSVHVLRTRRRAEGWRTRASPCKPGPRQGYKPTRAEALERRLCALLKVSSAMLEKRLAREGMTDANAAMLAQLCRAQESFMRTTHTKKAGKARERHHDRSEPDGPADGAARAADIARKRTEIERRILRIRQAYGMEEPS